MWEKLLYGQQWGSELLGGLDQIETVIGPKCVLNPTKSNANWLTIGHCSRYCKMTMIKHYCFP